jgi:uncharacterized membrane protein YkoI
MITKEEAIEIASKRAEEKGWAFSDSLGVTVRHGWRGEILRFEIETDPGMRGTKTRFTIDAKTGEILSEGYIPR